jgi:ubiquinone biosynthesis protein
MQLSTLTHLKRNARRLAEIVSILSKYGLADWLSGLDYEWLQGRLVSFDGERLGKVSHETRIRLALTELGTTFIKLGQMLSTRADIVGPALAEELSQLRSNAPLQPTKTVKATIQAELGKPVEELFRMFDEQPLASASIGQVHRAQLLSGELAVVKVQHAGIEDKINDDLDIMAGLAELLRKHVPQLRPYQPVVIVREFRRTLLHELDFGSERRNLKEFSRNFVNEPHIHFPAVYGDLCSRRVLTMELLTGISGEDLEGLRRADFDLDEFARRGANMYLEMIFRDGFYHADPHPGNMMLLPGVVVGVLDCGMVGRIDEQLREDIEDVLLAIPQMDTRELTDIVMRVGAVPTDLDRDGLRAEISSFVAEYANITAAELNLSDALNRVFDVIRRYHIVLPAPGSLLLKTLVMLEGSARLLNPSFSLAELIHPYALKTLRRRFSVRRWFGKMHRAARDWNRLFEILPRDLSEILRRMRSGTFEIRHEHQRLEATLNRLVLAILTGALLVGSAELWSRAALPTVEGVSVPGVIGYMTAVVMGFRLLRTIGHSDDGPGKFDA